jgi:hypothetical protein
MHFEAEDLKGREPVRLIAEHRLMQRWVAEHPRGSDPSWLLARYVDAREGAALYVMDGLGMGDGQSFALVRGPDIVLFDVWRRSRRGGAARGQEAYLDSISIAERSDLPRGAVIELISSSFENYLRLNDFAYPFFGPCSLDVGRVRWDIRPERYSVLYVRTKLDKWYGTQKPKVKKWAAHAASPLAALFLLGCTWAWPAPDSWGQWQHLPSLVAAACVLQRWLTYDNDCRFGPWLIGIREWRNPLLVIGEALGRITEPRPLDLLAATLDLSGLARSVVTLTITNKSAWPIRYVGVQSSTLGELLAPGLVAAIRAGQLERKVVEQQYPARSRRWLLPYQSVRWTLAARAETSPAQTPPRLSVLVSVTRFATGDRRTRPGVYLIPMTTRR